MSPQAPPTAPAAAPAAAPTNGSAQAGVQPKALTKENLEKLEFVEAPKSGALGWCMARQLELTLCVLLVILTGNVLTPAVQRSSTHYTPSPSLHYNSVWPRFLYISFQQQETGLYFKGRDDAYFIFFWIVLFWFAREAAMKWVLNPWGRWVGVTSTRKLARWSEQSWAMAFPTVFWTLGMYIMQTSPYKNLTTEQYYIGYPHDALPGLTKWYYLVQTAFWLQQIVVLNLEERRKDFHVMFTHHIVTTLLMCFSYVLNWTRVGNAILCCMDFADIILPAAKLSLYAKKIKLADGLLAFYVVSWIVTRHVLFGIILWSVAFELPVKAPYGWSPSEGYFNHFYSHSCFVALLTTLQILICIWLSMILKVAWSAVTGNGPADSRSDSGGSESDSEEIVLIEDDDELSKKDR